MKTIQYLGNDKIGLCEKPIPQIKDDEILIKVAFSGICGTDLHIAEGKHPRAKAGLTMGHEFSGIVAEVGSKGNFSIGDHVVVEPLISCGVCYSCRSGYPHVCQKLGLYGIDEDGGFGEYVAIPAEKVISLPKEISLEYGALVEPLAVGVHAVRMSKLKSMDKVLVIGGGPIGFFVALAARQAGADVYVSEINEFRQQSIESFGFSSFNPNKTTQKEMIDFITNGRGFDIVFDAAGGATTLKSAVECVRVRGQVVMVAIPPMDCPISYVPISFKEVALVGIRVYEYFDFQRAIAFLQKSKIDLTSIYSIFEVEDFKKGFASAKDGSSVMRVLFDFTGGKKA